jgi:hypothetical protein
MNPTLTNDIARLVAQLPRVVSLEAAVAAREPEV